MENLKSAVDTLTNDLQELKELTIKNLRSISELELILEFDNLYIAELKTNLTSEQKQSPVIQEYTSRRSEMVNNYIARRH